MVVRNYPSGVCAFLLGASLALRAFGAEAPPPRQPAPSPEQPAVEQHFKAEQQTSEGSVSIGGRNIDYQALAGTLVIHPKGWDDVPQNADKDKPVPEASMFYAAYFAKGAKAERRPITFLYNGGPGSSTVWLHMGAFGPRRVVTASDTHTAAAPYEIVPNEYSLLDVSDLVFVDAPGTGFSRIGGKDKEREKAFYGIDADAQAFVDFIYQFLSRYERWNSPKFLFGESYGTTRNAVVVNLLQSERFVDVNGVIDLSQAQLWEDLPDFEDANPGSDLVFVLGLPTFAATAWYHHALAPDAPRELEALLKEVEQFATSEYLVALQAGAGLDAAERRSIVRKLNRYTGLPEATIEKANLRISGGVFEKHLKGDSDVTVGRLDSRFSGPTMDPLSKAADYDPQEAAIGSAYVSALNKYVRSDLKFGADRTYKPEIDVFPVWNFQHQAPGIPAALPLTPNVLPDLAAAMKRNPQLKVMFNSGYYDIATPFFATLYERDHLSIPEKLRANVEVALYESGHMVYAHEASHRALHDKVASFIQRASAEPAAATQRDR
jgi:carboxypeptidase C (cathepsin A)